MHSPSATVRGNIAFKQARNRANYAVDSIDPSVKDHDLSVEPINSAKTPKEQAALLLKVISDVAEVLNLEVEEKKKAKSYKFELSDYEIAKEGIETLEQAFSKLNAILKSSFQATSDLDQKIQAHNPNTLPKAKQENDDSFLKFAGKETEAIEAGERYQPDQEKALTLENLNMPEAPGAWNANRLTISDGKVRTSYWRDDRTGVMIARDTTSALDIPNLCDIPGKGAMLNGITNHWLDHEFSKIGYKYGISDHRVVDMKNIDPNLMLVNKVTPLPVEVVLRRYITGSADKAYKSGQRQFGSHMLPDGIQRNDRLDSVVVDPTIKGRDSDKKITDGVAANLVGFEDWKKIKAAATELFEAAEKKANEKGLILVDTKFEFGKAANGDLVLIDEILTPDSSRYWSITDYQKAIAEGRDPEDYSKEPLRTWIKKTAGGKSIQLDDFKDDKAALKEVLGKVPDSVINTLAHRYAAIYKSFTGKDFVLDLQNQPNVNTRIQANLRKAGIME